MQHTINHLTLSVATNLDVKSGLIHTNGHDDTPEHLTSESSYYNNNQSTDQHVSPTNDQCQQIFHQKQMQIKLNGI